MSADWAALVSPTGIIALWGAILSTIAVVWNIRRDVLQRADLRVSVDVAMIGSPGQGIVANNLLRFIMTNQGHRPVTPVNVGGKLREPDTRRFALMHDPRWGQLRTLGHSETATVVVDDLSVLNDNLDCLWVTDSTGKHWKASRASMRQLRQSPEWGRHQPGTRTTRSL